MKQTYPNSDEHKQNAQDANDGGLEPILAVFESKPSFGNIPQEVSLT